jgi:hypothetical protein
MSRRVTVCFVTGAALVLALTVCQQAQAQRFRGPRGGSMLPDSVSTVAVAMMPAVQKELALDQAAQDKVTGLVHEVRDEGRKLMSEGGESPAELHKKLEAEFAPKLAAILDKNQQTRVREIAIQAAGVHALQDETVAKSLELTKDEQDKIATIVKEHARGAEGRHEQLDKAVAVLTKDQQEKFEKMKGKPFTFPAAGRTRRMVRPSVGASPEK